MALSEGRSAKTDSLLAQGVAVIRGWPWRFLGTLTGIVLIAALALFGYQASARTVTVVVDGASRTFSTHHHLVGDVISQAGLVLGPGDEASPPLDAAWQTGSAIIINHAVPVIVRADGREVRFHGQPRSVLEVLARTAISLQPNDKVYVNRMPLPESAYADETALRTLLALQTGVRHMAAPLPRVRTLTVDIVRAVPLYIHDNGADIEIRTTATSLGSALEGAHFRIYRADRVFPPLDTPVTPGLHMVISRATPVRLSADGHSYETRTWVRTVQELLQEEKLVLNPSDRVTPALETPLQPGMAVRVVRVTTFDLTIETPIAFVHRQEADPSLELDNYRLQPGREGVRAQVTRITYEDGQEISRQHLGEQVLREPVDQVFYYGTSIVIRTLDTPHGTIEYWRKFRVWATSYFPSTCDKSPNDPEYGITYTGRRATRGIVAVDPRVIPLHTKMYVPGYGPGAAEDIGGKIKGRHIDVCYDDADWGKGLWDTHYVDIYLLTPVPPLNRIPWILPDQLPGPGR
jgi:uncharacterized protein YabE (DUF348 family)